MITEIGIIAGEIWHFLDKHGMVSLHKLIVGIEKPKELVLMSLGWLAREGHVLVEFKDPDYVISLREENKSSKAE
ncbi:MAG: winged helix-turn-helix domain-containing protein [Candidatus Omnitrophica bacterium]|nr:winged helix-turn-helix domain-containing protein [Candidatus Omnitrophota bacterium]